MNMQRKIVWAEGVLLAQQHFQQWDRYYEEQLKFRFARTQSFSWGLVNLQVSQRKLAENKFSVIRCDAVLRCGEIISYDEDSDGVLECDISEKTKKR